MRRRREMPNRLKTIARTLSIAALLAGCLTAATIAPDGGDRCRNVSVSVRLSAGTPRDQTIAGTLCEPGRTRAGGSVVDVLVHGGTYNRTYWDWPTQYPKYSYVRRTLNASRATFAYDRLGAGTSSRPPSADETITNEAYVLHQVITWLNRHNKFAHINIIGHSFGSVIAAKEAATYHDATKLVLTGYLNAIGPAGDDFSVAYPADLDPRFAGRGYDPGYLTTTPGARAGLFYSPSADPAIIASDEATKDVISGAILTGGLAELTAPAGANTSNQVTAKVLVITGTEDRIYCGISIDCADLDAVRTHEQPYFTAAKSLTVTTVPRTGHDLALHPTAGSSFATINAWLRGN